MYIERAGVLGLDDGVELPLGRLDAHSVSRDRVISHVDRARVVNVTQITRIFNIKSIKDFRAVED